MRKFGGNLLRWLAMRFLVVKSVKIDKNSFCFFFRQTYARPNCQRILTGDSKYVKEQAKRRLTMAKGTEQEVDIPMDCASIRARQHFVDTPLTDRERQFPLAYARIVYKVGGMMYGDWWSEL